MTDQPDHKGYVVFDTETTGIPARNVKGQAPVPADADGQPRLAELAMIFCDLEFNIERIYQAYVKPDGWEMPADAAAHNGLTMEFLNEHGLPLDEVLTEYQNAILEGRIVVAYGAQFDTKIMRGELRRRGKDDLFEQTPNICVMRGSMGIVKKPDGKGGWPKLEHACAHFRHEHPDTPEAQHHYGPCKALADANGARKVARSLAVIGRLPAPAVHRNANHPGRASDDA